MPKLHKYVPSSSKDGFYIYAMHNGQNVTYQVTPIARRIFEKLGYGDKTELTGEMLYTLHRLRLIYTNKSGVEPPTSFDEITKQVELPDSAKGDRKRFFNTLLEEGSFDKEEQEDLSQYLQSQDIEPDRKKDQPSKKGTWRPTSPDDGNLHRGIVEFFNETAGYGFIDFPDLDENVYYHMEEIGGHDIQEGTKLEFTWTDTDNGPRATHVRQLNQNQSLEATSDEDSATDQKHASLKQSLNDRPPLEKYQQAAAYSMEISVTFLGTGGKWPTEDRVPNAIHIDRRSDSFLFDVGEGTYRQMDQYDVDSGIDAVFLTSTEPDHIEGLGTLLTSLSLQERSDQLEIYVPASGVEIIESLLRIYGPMEYPVEVCPVNNDTVYETGRYTITAFDTGTDGRRKGYVFEEVPRRGRFNRSRAESFGVPPSQDFTRLCNGEVVTIDDGTEIDPRHVVGAPTPGRRIVYTGDVSDGAKISSAATDADLLIHEAAYVDTQSNKDEIADHASGKIAGYAAQKSDAEQLILTNIPPGTETDIRPLVKEAESEFDGDVKLASDGGSLTLPAPDPEELSTEADTALEKPSIKLGETVNQSDITEGMYVQVKVDRGSSRKGLSEGGYIHIIDGDEYVGEKVIVKVLAEKQGFVTARVKEPSSDTTIYQYVPNKSKSKKTGKRSTKKENKSRKKPSQSQRKYSTQERNRKTPNPFKGQNSKLRELIRKKH